MQRDALLEAAASQATSEKSSFAQSTAYLIESLATCGLDVPEGLAEELLRRSDAAASLVELVRLHRYWSLTGPGEGWTPIHALALLATRGNREGFQVLEEVLRHCPDDLEDWLTEEVPCWLFAYGLEYLPELERILLDESLDIMVRLGAAEALAAHAHVHAELKPEVAKILLQVTRRAADSVLVGFLTVTLAEFRDHSMKEELKSLLRRPKVRQERIADEADIEEIYAGKGPDHWRDVTRDPMEHFRRSNLEHLKRVNKNVRSAHGFQAPELSSSDVSKPKIGRNDPCPCGSGKKYKKCHGRPGSQPLSSTTGPHFRKQ